VAEQEPDRGAVEQREPEPPRRPALRWELFALAEIVALCGLALAQPLLDVVGRSPDFLLFHGAGLREAVVLAVVAAAVPPLTLWGLAAATRLGGHPARRWTHVALIGALAAAFAVQAGKHVPGLRGAFLAALAAVVGVATAAAYVRFATVSAVLRYAAVGPLVFVLLFVFVSPASGVLLERRPAGASAGATETGPHPPVVVILLDEFPLTTLLDETGRVDPRRAPNVARFARESTWYRNATAVNGHTTHAVPTMLTGQYAVDERDVPHYSRYPDNLFTLLGEVYDVRAWETVTQLCPPQRCRHQVKRAGGGLSAILRESASLIGQIASPYDSVEDPTATYAEATVGDAKTTDRPPESGPRFRFGRLRENQPARFADFVDDIRESPRGDRPELRFLHLLLPHSPWRYLPSGVRYVGTGNLPFDGPWWARLAHQRHVQQAGYADRLLGEALAVLRETGRYDESLIVVTSDHGDSFSQGVSGRDMDKAQLAAAEVAWVPVFIKEPGQRAGRVDDRNWEQIDLLPTIADYAGVSVPWRTDGMSARRERRQTEAKRFDQIAGVPITLDDPTHFQTVLRGPAARPVLPEIPELSLVGRRVTDFTVAGGGPRADVGNRKDFADVRPDSGVLPALVHATVPEPLPDGTPVAIAVNGRIGAVALAEPDTKGQQRIVGLIPEESAFRPGANELDLFVVRDGGRTLQRMALGG
jgi:hypothetical protein